ncbi:MAG: hypothetical protein ACRD2R_08645, partial [Terriglobales bacterium]
FEARLDATWSAGAKGRMVRHEGLIHCLQSPTVEHQRRYKKAMGQTRVVRGALHRKTLYAGCQEVLCGIYDELIMGVEGYALAGKALANVEEIRREMDGSHKLAAAQQLFAEPEAAAEAEAAA